MRRAISGEGGLAPLRHCGLVQSRVIKQDR
jgi:hypothetical protein